MILVTGATGPLGDAIVRCLRSLDLQVRALVREGSDYFWLNDTGATYRFGDLRDPESLSRATAGVRAIIAASGIDVETRGAHHGNVTVAGHAALWSAAYAHGARKAVLVSAVGVERIDAPWYRARARAEEGLVESGLAWTVLRVPPLSHTWARLALSPPPLHLGRGRNRVTTLATADAARLAVIALDEPAWQGKAVSAFGPRTLTAAELLERAHRIAGSRESRHLGGLASRLAPWAALPAGRRWTRALMHRAALLQEDFAPPGPPAAEIAGVRLTGPDRALIRDLAWLRDRVDPEAAARLAPPRRFKAEAYTPGESPLDDAPAGPRTYE